MPDEDREKALELVKDPAKKPRSHFLRFELRSLIQGDGARARTKFPNELASEITMRV